MNTTRRPDILVVGGGFAAIWTAAAAARRRREAGVSPDYLSIALVAPGDDMVIRPRLYEARPSEMRVPLRRFLEPIGVRHVRAIVEEVDVDRRQVVAVSGDGARLRTTFRRLVIAAGSRLVRSAGLPGAGHLHDVDTLPAAVALDRHLHRLPSGPVADGRYTAVVIGAGFVGLELATELVTRLQLIAAPHGAIDQVRVVLVERAPVVGPELGRGPCRAIEEALDELGVERRLGTTMTALDDRVVRLGDGAVIPAQTAAWTAGMQASPITRNVPGPLDELGRLVVDRHMRVIGGGPVFAAGDTASIEVAPGQRALQACQYAHQMGKHAGHNAASDLLGLPLAEFEPEPYVTCLDLGHAGAVYTEGFERTVRATGSSAKQIKRRINRDLIYPPLDDAVEILRRADHAADRSPTEKVAV
jgi:NADH:quinone reductase (non-electrogenic)